MTGRRRITEAVAAVGVAEHSGCAELVAIAPRAGAIAVIDRRRVELIDAGLPNQPYHHEALELPPHEAQALVDRVRRSVDVCCRRALEQLRADLAPDRLVALAIREPPGPPIPSSVAEVLESYRVTCMADGEMYRQTLCDKAAALGIEVIRHRKGAEHERAASALRVSAARVQKRIAELGSALGPPWRDEHRRATAAAIAALARHVVLELGR
jgi:hypothetical protein